MEKLDQVGATILGIVLNKVTRQTGRNYGYSYGYGYKPYRAEASPVITADGAPEREQQGVSRIISLRADHSRFFAGRGITDNCWTRDYEGAGLHAGEDQRTHVGGIH